MTTRERVAAERYLTLTGCHIIYNDFLDRFIVMEDDEGLALVDVFLKTDGMFGDLPALKRDVFEDAICKFYLQEHEPIDVPIRYDTVELLVRGEDRALVRHRINAELEM